LWRSTRGGDGTNIDELHNDLDDQGTGTNIDELHHHIDDQSTDANRIPGYTVPGMGSNGRRGRMAA